MAQMHPRSLLEEELKSRAEGKVFEALRDGLSDEWEVYHSASVIYRDHVAGAQDDESDFVLFCHPDKGVICLEVKGGGIECRHGEWYSVGARRRAGTHARPVLSGPRPPLLTRAQAARLSEVGRSRSAARPRARLSRHLGARTRACARRAAADHDRGDFRPIEPAIERVLGYHRGSDDRREPPGRAGADAVREVLAPRIQIEVPMATRFMEEEEELVLRTHEQSALLQRFGRDKRMVVTGCAGSGKTMLALERAARGEEVLFVCFNKGLLEHLRRTERHERSSFFTFHGLCLHPAHRAGVALPSYPRGEAPPEFFRDELPHALLEATDALGGLYDHLLVDEAQDLHGDWLEALTTTLRSPEGSVWLFMDDNQRIYGAALEVPDENRPFDLTVNCRNTQAIHQEVMKLYRGEVTPEVKGPAGRPIELLHSDDAPGTIKGVLARLCGKEEVPPQDLVVLSSHGAANSEVFSSGGGPYTFTQERGKLGKFVQFSSVRAFKGLESPVVVLCELEDLDEESRDQQLYVALSRAKNHCVVVAPQA